MRRAAFALLLAAASVHGDEPELRHYLWRMPLQGNVVSGQLYSVKVGESIVDACRAFPVDVRVVDRAGRHWPFFLFSPAGSVETVSLQAVDASADDAKHGIQTLWFDAGVRHRPLRTMRLQAAGTNFAIPVKIYGRNEPTNAWRWVADGGIHRMNDQVREDVALRGCEYRWIKVELYHYESAAPAVTNIQAEGPSQFLVFEAHGDEAPFVYFASPKFNLPYYDLRKRTTDEAARIAPALELGRKRMNPERLAVSLGRYGRWLTVAAATIVGALALIVIMNVIRRRAL